MDSYLYNSLSNCPHKKKRMILGRVLDTSVIFSRRELVDGCHVNAMRYF